ncbi:MAG: CDGSH iron-sulfur domain-containing protein [Actinomycetes bacterium]
MSDETREVFTYSGEAAEVSWDGRLCIHVSECSRAQGELFVRGRKPWGDPDQATADEIADVVARCPTGALSYAPKADGPAAERPPTENTIVVANNGPLYVRGDLRIDDAPDDMPGITTRAALCRCGHSARKPFCDGSHEKDGFVDRGAIGSSGDGFASPGGELAIASRPNGPYLVVGNVTLVTGHGERRWQGTKTALCRCGESSNKPFCDGAHAKIGFTT